MAWPQGVMLIGGLDVQGVISARTDVYDRSTNTWTRGPDLSAPRFALAAVSLDDGRVMVVGGKNDPLPSFVTAQPTTELIEPESGVLDLAPPMPIGRQFHRAVRLDDGRVLVAGGAPSDGADTRVLLFDPTTNVWAGENTSAGVPTGPGTTISAASNGAWIADGKGVHFFDAGTHAFTAVHTFDAAHELKQPLMTRLGDSFVIADHVANVGVGDRLDIRWLEYSQSSSVRWSRSQRTATSPSSAVSPPWRFRWTSLGRRRSYPSGGPPKWSDSTTARSSQSQEAK